MGGGTKAVYPSKLYLFMVITLSIIILGFLYIRAANGDAEAATALPLTAAILLAVNIYVLLSYFGKIPLLIMR